MRDSISSAQQQAYQYSSKLFTLVAKYAPEGKAAALQISVICRRNQFALLLIGVSLLVPTLMLATRSKAKAPLPAATVVKHGTFNDRFRSSVVDVALSRPQADMLPTVKRVRTETIRMAADQPVPVVEKENEEPTVIPMPIPRPHIATPPRARVLRQHGDICQRHKMRKVYYGRTWRCRR